MRISDWSSDVCSSDLIAEGLGDDLAYLHLHQVACSNVFLGLQNGVDVVFLVEVAAAFRLHAGVGVRNDHGGAKFFAQLFQSAPGQCKGFGLARVGRSEEHTSELQSLMRISSAVFCLKQQTNTLNRQNIA